MAGSYSIPVHSRSSNGTPLYECVCADCGKVRIADKRKLDKPCHQCAMKRRRTHGMASGGRLHPLYKLLKSMIARCTIASATNYKYYGGRGIRVCDEWIESPLAFAEWARAAGWSAGLEIDRIDGDGDYSPGNCRFVTRRKNSQNRRNGVMSQELANEIRQAYALGMTIIEAANSFGVSYMSAWHLKKSADAWREHAP